MTGRSSVQRVYFLLAAFNVGTLLVSLWLGHQLMVTFQGSVADNGQWAGRLAGYAQLGQLVAEANAPGNDVFVDKDVEGQRNKLAAIRTKAEVQFASARADLDTLPRAQADVLEARLDDARREFNQMLGEADAIFVDFAAGRTESAGEHMGQMDQAFGRTSAALDGLRSRVQEIQSGLFAVQLGAAQSSQSAQYVLMAFVVLMVCAVVSYGFRLQRTFVRKQQEIDRANEGMRRVLDNVDQGLLTVDPSGAIVGECSQTARSWLGDISPGDTVWAVVARSDPGQGAWLQSAWDMLREDFMPMDVVLDQLPHRAVLGARTVNLDYRPILRDGALTSVLVVISDVTAQLASEKTEAAQKENLAMFQRVMRDRQGFVDSFEECSRLVERLATPGPRDLTVVKRELHTLKGNAASLGLLSFSVLCHGIEDQLQETEGDLTPADTAQLSKAWDVLTATLQNLLGERGEEVVIAIGEYQAMVDAVAKDNSSVTVQEMVRALGMEPARRRFERLTEQAQSIASRLQKGPVEVSVRGGNLRFDRERWGGFFSSLVHVVRNAVDHGLEAPAEREAQHKPATGAVRFEAVMRGGEVTVTIADDGGGIDFAALVAAARSRGHEVKDGVEALFLDGVSTRTAVSDLSGRGVGMAAAKAAAERLGGRVEVTSSRGAGAVFAFTFPAVGVSELPEISARAA